MGQGGIRVLVVDDEADARDVVRLVLSQAGASVICAQSAPDALQILEAGTRVDVIISDIGMPGMDGYELIRSLRALSAVTGMVPAIALTAYGREDDRVRALACGYQDHHAKPVAPAQLVAAVWRAHASLQYGR